MTPATDQLIGLLIHIRTVGMQMRNLHDQNSAWTRSYCAAGAKQAFDLGLNGFRHLWMSLLFVLLGGGLSGAEDPAKKILMVAGNPSHGFGSHEHYAGLMLLADALKNSGAKVDATVTRGWPSDDSLVSAADAIVIFSDGGGGHPALPHRDAIRERLKKGAGFVCIHYATEVPKGEPGDDWLEFLGGYFETHWSVNPHWVAEFKTLPNHPVTAGVKPFKANDEWYFHLRFAPSPAKITPILQAVAPEETMRRPDGPHSGNPDVRKSVAASEPQTVAWTFERPDGGRSFGITGAHYHWNWGNPSMLQLVTNAIAWTAGVDVPKEGLKVEKPGMPKLLENQDYQPPKDFDAEKVAKEFSITAANAKTPNKRSLADPKPRLLASTPVITSSTRGHEVTLDVALGDAKDIYLVATDGGDGYGCDWADWIEPTLYQKNADKTLLLTSIDWQRATSGWGAVRLGKNAGGESLSVKGVEIKSAGIGTHANSLIHYRIPDGYSHLRVRCALDTGGTCQNDGSQTSVRFMVFADHAPDIQSLESSTANAQRAPENAVAGLDVAEGLQVTLAASEPELRSLTNLDIDDRGRVWVCDVMNYRGNNGSRPEGDRILILEDTNGDGVMDTSKTFYQGRDIDSAMGLCVLGNEVIVSAAPYVWRLTDTDGDDVADKKVAMFTETGQPQHDHSNHSFLFGPDGKLYWNFGNTGKHVKDGNGNIVVDIYGREVIENGKPFYGGMPFRCNLDGSEFEVLAHNFRNNWETTVDSFGTLWQSDNDDDGNRGVRINFVMEHGNYGYTDELTGAGWQADRINIESEIPLRHWHLNDPGVVPNLLQTGAGSPCGICVYEGDLLPERYRDQVIHCDAGPNVVRAYPVVAKGAGYEATIDPLVTGSRDKWFRPADVCVAPDGSLFVTDWYDPGVGGHRQEDVSRGRLFRIAPPGTPYKVPKFDYSTVDGAIAALHSPTLAVRYKAWMALHAMGKDAEPALLKMYAESNDRYRARALWLLGKIEGRGEHYVQLALKDQSESIRVAAIRLMRQLKLPAASTLAAITEDPSAAVRREALIALRFDKSPEMPAVWASLAKHHDGDRWYLEALGIGSDLRARECYDAYQQAAPEHLASTNGLDVLWRLRAPQAAMHLARAIADAKSNSNETDRLFRALEYHPEPVRRQALVSTVLNASYAAAADADAQKDHDAIIVRAMERVSRGTVSDAAVQASVNRYVQQRKGTSEYLTLVKRFRPAGYEAPLADLALTIDDDNAAVEALKLLSESSSGLDACEQGFAGKDPQQATRLVRRVGLLGSEKATRTLVQLMKNTDATFDLRAEAVRGLAKNNLGAKRLVNLVGSNELPGDLKLLVGGLLAKSSDDGVRAMAAKLIPMPAHADAKPLPPLDELAKMSGDVTAGEAMFRSKGTCANCHVVNGFGKQVGPDLSEIGAKLSREAMFTAILDPSAGISHNYENYILLLDSGQVVSGVMVSQTDDEMTIRTADAIDRTFAQEEIVEAKKSEKSIMPDNLHHAFDQQGLVDIVEYMTTLKQKKL